MNDTSNNGLTDILKRGSDADRKLLMTTPSNEDAITFGGAKFKQTTTCPTVTISSNTYYETYVVGDDAVFSVFLGKNPESGEKNYKLFVQMAPENGSVSDPSRVIGGFQKAA